MPDVPDIEDDSHDGHDDRPLPYVPMKAVGNPTNIGTAALAFTDVTKAVGLPTTTGLAVAFVDFDDDGWPDLIGVADQGLVIYRNVGGTFEDVTYIVLSGPQETPREAAQTVLGDADGDGDLDLYLASREGQDVLYLNNGLGSFAPAPGGAGLPESTDAQGVTFADVDRDGHLDIYVARGRRFDADELDPPLEDGAAGRPNALLRNKGDGTFEDVTAAWGAAAGDTSETFQALFADFDRDGFQDALVVRDFESDHYFHNDGGKTFIDKSKTNIYDDGTALMGMAVGDVNGDGHLDIFATNRRTDYMYFGAGDGTFENVYEEVLVGPDPTTLLSEWGCALADFDNDGDQDVIAIGADEYVVSGPEAALRGAWVLLENDKGALVDVTDDAKLGWRASGQSLGVADFDLDGDLDVAVGLEVGLPPESGPREDLPTGLRLLRNDSARAAGNRFLELALRAESGNRFAVGAIVDVDTGSRKTSRVVTAGASHRSAHTFVQHFGLGPSVAAKLVTITWPDGVKTVAHNVPAGYHRLAPHDGDCCVGDGACDVEAPQCPVWYPANEPCKGAADCTVCTLICERLAKCGDLDFDCIPECNAEPPIPWVVKCVNDNECADVLECFML